MELLYVVCQLAAASVCEEHRAAMPGAGPMVCVYLAPAELAQLARPGWRVARWSCGAQGDAAASPGLPETWDRAALTE